MKGSNRYLELIVIYSIPKYIGGRKTIYCIYTVCSAKDFIKPETRCVIIDPLFNHAIREKCCNQS